MKSVNSPDEIIQKAKDLSEQKKSWHFHILTPGCLLNSYPDYALILEVPSDGQTFVNYSKEKPMEAGKELVKLLHGGDVVQDTSLASTAASDGIKKILERALTNKCARRLLAPSYAFPGLYF